MNTQTNENNRSELQEKTNVSKLNVPQLKSFKELLDQASAQLQKTYDANALAAKKKAS